MNTLFDNGGAISISSVGVLQNGGTIEERIAALDVTLFDAIPSQTQEGDRSSLLLIQRELRKGGDYTYLEIGSHLGGTIQPHYADPRCRRIYSIDKRPLAQPDERGCVYEYPTNSTQSMRDNLRKAFPEIAAEKLTTFDTDASTVAVKDIREAPTFCFIDGEHTNAAVISDFRFCLRVTASSAVIALHDSGFVFEGIQAIKRELATRSIPFEGLKLGGSVYAFVLGETTSPWKASLAVECQDEDSYFRASTFYRRRLQREARLRASPTLLKGYRTVTAVKDWLYVHVYCRLRGGGKVGRDA